MALSQSDSSTTDKNRADSDRFKIAVFIALPSMVLLLSFLDFLGGLLRSGFWADDFLSLTFYSSSSNFFNLSVDLGKFATNVFWKFGTMAFGSGSAVPYLLLNTAIFVSGLAMWIFACRGKYWPGSIGWWIAGMLMANAAWLPITMWSSNVTHSAAFFSLGVAMLCHERVINAEDYRHAILWSLTGAIAWTAVIASDSLYLGVVILGAYCALVQCHFLQRWKKSRWLSFSIFGWNILPPVLYFVLVGYPQQVKSAAYSGGGLRFLSVNFQYYHLQLSPSVWTNAIYLFIAAVTCCGAMGALYRRDYFPAACVVAAAVMIGIILTQSNQRDVHYTVMAFMLILSACASGWTTCFRTYEWTRRNASLFCRAALSTGILALGVLFHSGINLRSYFSASPYGGELSIFREGVSTLVPRGAQLCAILNLSQSNVQLFDAEISGTRGFSVAPISASSTYLVANRSQCPLTATSTVGVQISPAGNFQAYAISKSTSSSG